jgi:hypothetical protein
MSTVGGISTYLSHHVDLVVALVGVSLVDADGINPAQCRRGQSQTPDPEIFEEVPTNLDIARASDVQCVSVLFTPHIRKGSAGRAILKLGVLKGANKIVLSYPRVHHQ